MTREEIRSEMRSLVEEAVRAARATNESAMMQTMLAELDAAIADRESYVGGHHGLVDAHQTPVSEGPFTPVYEEPEQDEEVTSQEDWVNK